MNELIEALETLKQVAARTKEKMDFDSDTALVHAACDQITARCDIWIGNVAHARSLVQQREGGEDTVAEPEPEVETETETKTEPETEPEKEPAKPKKAAAKKSEE